VTSVDPYANSLPECLLINLRRCTNPAKPTPS
jgi:hypothetical protein